VLLVDHDEGKVVEVDVLLQERVRAHHDAGVARDDVEQLSPLLRGRERPRQEGDARAHVLAAEPTSLTE
jgi:hypothetical protein